MIFAFVIIRKNKIPLLPQKRENLWLLLLRAAAGTVGILCNFYAVDRLALSDASMLNKMSPFFAVLFSAFLLKEKPALYQIAAIFTAFVGAVFIIKPTFENADLVPSLVGFAGGMCAGLAYSAVRKLSQNGEKSPFIVFFFSAFSCGTVLPFLIFDFHPMSLTQVLFLLLAGLSASGGQFAITSAYSCAPAKEISVFDYSQIIFSAMLGFFVFGQKPDLLSFLGYAVIISMAVLMFLKNRNSAVKDRR